MIKKKYFQKKKKNFTPGGRNAIGEIEYNNENEKIHLPILNLLIQMKRQTCKYMIEQRSCGQYFSLQLSISEFNRKITLLFHYLGKIEEYASQLFCSGEIENVKEAMKIY